MAQLSSVIGTILRETIAAQHEANLYSLSLSEEYGKNGKVRDFQLPGVFISDMELELKYAVIGTGGTKERGRILSAGLRRFVRTLSSEAAKAASEALASVVTDSAIGREDEDTAFFRRLKNDTDTAAEFRGFLSRSMREALFSDLTGLVDGETGEVRVDVVAGKLTDTVREMFLDSSELKDLFAGRDGRELKDLSGESVGSAVEALVRKLSKGKNFREVDLLPEIDVAVTAEELSKVPSDAIHTFKFKISPTVCNVTDPDEEVTLTDFEAATRKRQ